MKNVMSIWLALLLSLTAFSTDAFAGFGLNLGYDNPRGSDIGLNLLFRGKNFGGELGFGYVDGVLDGNQRVYTSGDFDLKFFISKGGKIEPYVLEHHFGFPVTTAIGDSWFAGLGLMGSTQGGGKGLMGYVAADTCLEQVISSTGKPVLALDFRIRKS